MKTRLLLLIFLAGILGCKKDGTTVPAAPANREVLKPVVAGQFYPESADATKGMISDFFKATPEITFQDNTLGFASPHAGFIYSGPVASYIFRNLPQNRYKKVVILFPSHWSQFRGILALDADAYATPLGDVPIARDDVRKLIAADPSIFWQPGLYTKEHSMEVMLPFLQTRLGNSFSIIPLMMGDQSPNMARRLAETLDRTLGAPDDLLYIASTDLSHYHEYAAANSIDAITLNQIMSLDPDALVGDLGAGRAEMCGYGPVLTLMRLSRMRGGESAKILQHANSGDTQGEKSRVVGYAAIQFFKK